MELQNLALQKMVLNSGSSLKVDCTKRNLLDFYKGRYLIVHDGVKSDLSGCSNAQMKDVINLIVKNNNAQLAVTKDEATKKDLMITNARLQGWIKMLGNGNPNQKWGRLDLMMMLV